MGFMSIVGFVFVFCVGLYFMFVGIFGMFASYVFGAKSTLGGASIVFLGGACVMWWAISNSPIHFSIGVM